MTSVNPKKTTVYYSARSQVPIQVSDQTTRREDCAYELQPSVYHRQRVCVPRENGIKECTIKEVRDPRMRLLPMSCDERKVTVTNGATVTRTVTTDGLMTDESVVTRPNTETFLVKTNKVASSKAPLSLRFVPRYDVDEKNKSFADEISKKPIISNLEQVQPQATAPASTMTSRTLVGMKATTRNLGGGVVSGPNLTKAPTRPSVTAPAALVAKQNVAKQAKLNAKPVGGAVPHLNASQASHASHAKKVGGQRPNIVELPTPGEVRNAEFKVTRDDLDYQDIPVGFEEQSKAFPAGLPLPPPGSTYEYEEGEYGQSQRRKRDQGYAFPGTDLPYSAMRESDRDLYQYLVSTFYRMDMMFPTEITGSVGPVFPGEAYDSAHDTMATIQANLLYFLGDAETRMFPIDRSTLFGEVKDDIKARLHPILRKYIEMPRRDVYESPQIPSTRPFVKSEATNSQDEKIRQPLIALARSIQKVAQSKKITIFFGPGENASIYQIEADLHAMWARLQSKGYAINPKYAEFQGMVGQIMQNRKLFSETTIKYLDLYSDVQSNEPFYYLPILRDEQLKAQRMDLQRHHNGQRGLWTSHGFDKFKNPYVNAMAL